MLKKKRFSGLFGTGPMEIPSPGPEHVAQAAQQQQVTSPIPIPANGAGGGGGTEGGNRSSVYSTSPTMLSNTSRQQSYMNLSSGTTSPNAASGVPGFRPFSALANSQSQEQAGNNNNNMNSGAYTTAAVGGPQPVDDEGINSNLTRNEVHQSLDNLKKLVIAAESYRELTAKLAKTTKQLSKCFKDYGDSKGMDSTHVNCLKSCSNFYDAYAEMESKLSTCLQKDFELLQHNWEKHSKRVLKDEKAHDELLQDLDEKIKKITASYDKKNKKPDPNTALISHEKYISNLTELQESIASAKRDHRNNISRRERYTQSLTAQIVCRISEAQFLAVERELRGCGPSLQKIKEWAPYAGLDMPPPPQVGGIMDGEPTIVVRGLGGSVDDYINAKSIGTNGTGTGASAGGPQQYGYANNNGSLELVADPSLSFPGNYKVPVVQQQQGTGGTVELPPISLPPFAPMQQQQQRDQQQQQQSRRQSYYEPAPAQPAPTGLPTMMPDPKNYIVPKQQQQQQQTHTTTTTTVSETKLQPVTTTTVTKIQTIAAAPEPKPVTVVQPQPVQQQSSEPVTPQDPSTQLPPTTPGAFPESALVSSSNSLDGAASSPEMRSLLQERAGAESTSLEDHGGSISTKVGSVYNDGGAGVLAQDKAIKLEYERELNQVDAVMQMQQLQAEALGVRRQPSPPFGREDGYLENDYAREDSLSNRGGNGVPRGMSEREYRDRELYLAGGGGGTAASRDRYSSVDPYYDQDAAYGQHPSSSKAGSRYYDDDLASQHSGMTQGRGGEYYNNRSSRYGGNDDGQEIYANERSSIIRPQPQPPRGYVVEDEWDIMPKQPSATSTITSSVSAAYATNHGHVTSPGYAREHYPTVRDNYPNRPMTLDDRERELEMQRRDRERERERERERGGGSSTPNKNGGGNGGGTVASLRRRFSDVSVSDIASVQGGQSNPGTQRSRGMSGSNGQYNNNGPLSPTSQQQQQQDLLMRRDNRYPPRASTPQSRVATSGYRYGGMVSTQSSSSLEYDSQHQSSSLPNKYSTGGGNVGGGGGLDQQGRPRRMSNAPRVN